MRLIKRSSIGVLWVRVLRSKINVDLMLYLRSNVLIVIQMFGRECFLPGSMCCVDKGGILAMGSQLVSGMINGFSLELS